MVADSDNSKEARNKIEAFDLVTEGLLSLDAYQRTRNKSNLSEAEKLLADAMEKLKENKQEPLYSRAKYFSLMVEYLKGSQEVAKKFNELKTVSEKVEEWSAYDAEVIYNAAAAYYSQQKYVHSAAYFEDARNAPAASPEVRLLAGAGLALSQAKHASNLTSKPEEQQEAWNLKQRVNELDRELRRERFINFLRLLWGVPHVELALTRKARKLIRKAKEEVSRISPPRAQTPTAQSGGLAGAT